MKPDHFKNIKPHECCKGCAYSIRIDHLGLDACIKHRFTIHGLLHEWRCDDFSTVAEPKPPRKNITDILGDNDHRGHHYTLVIPNAWVKGYEIRSVPPGKAHTLSGSIDGYSDSIRYEFAFDATDVLVEET